MVATSSNSASVATKATVITDTYLVEMVVQHALKVRRIYLVP